MTNFTKLRGRQVVVSCLPGVSVLSGTGIAGSVEARLIERGVIAVNERPTKAPAAVAAAQVSAYAGAAKGADLQQTWTGGGLAFGTASAAEHHTMRAFRGLEPWRDPA
jgi:hypothetical protein